MKVTVKGTESGGVRSLFVPTESNPENLVDIDKDDTNGMWNEIRNTDEVFDLILEQNFNMLSKSTIGMTATGALTEEILLDASNETFIKKILEGKVNATEYAKQFTNEIVVKHAMCVSHREPLVAS